MNRGEYTMWLYHLMKAFAVPLIGLYHRVTTYGKNNFDHNRNYVVVGNHVSHLDPIYIAAFFPKPLHYMAKKELFESKFLKWLLEHIGAFPVNREAADLGAVKKALRLLKDNESMGIFPEGGRAEKWDEQALKQGAAFFALRSKTPVLPVVIFGTKQAKPKGSNWVTPKKVRILYGQPIPIPEGDMSVNEFGAVIKQAMEQLLEEGTKRGWPSY